MCSALAWDAPSTAAVTVAVNINGTPTVVKPVANTSARTSNAGFDYCYVGSGQTPCAETGSWQAGSIKYDDGTTAGGIALPNWIVFSPSGNDVQTLTVTPPDGSYTSQTHKLFATFTPTNGSPITYTAMILTITCTVTGYDLPTVPAEPTFDLSYIVYAAPMKIDLSTLVYVEQPTCQWTTTSAITWTGLQSFMLQDTNNPSLITISTSDKTKATGSPYTLVYKRAITVTSAGQTGTTLFRSGGATDSLTF